MSTKQHLLLIATLALGTWLWLWPVAPGMLYFFATMNGDIEWRHNEEKG